MIWDATYLTLKQDMFSAKGWNNGQTHRQYMKPKGAYLRGGPRFGVSSTGSAQ